MRFSILRAFLVVAFAGACSLTGHERLMLANATQVTIGYMAVDQELAARIDPAPETAAANFDGQTVAAGQEVEVRPAQIEGYREGKPVTLFIYRISGDRATFARALVAPGGTSRITITPQALGL